MLVRVVFNCVCVILFMMRGPRRRTRCGSSAASDVYRRQQSNPLENSGPWQEWKLLGLCDSAVTENQAPNITVLTPANNSQFADKDSVVITAQATDEDGSVTKVEFFVDGALIATDSSAPFSTNWPAVVGTHQSVLYTYLTLPTTTQG